jgi:hypothetical protein
MGKGVRAKLVHGVAGLTAGQPRVAALVPCPPAVRDRSERLDEGVQVTVGLQVVLQLGEQRVARVAEVGEQRPV